MYLGLSKDVYKVGPEAEQVAKYLRLRELFTCKDTVYNL